MSLFPTTLRQALERAARPIAKKRGFSETRILTDWPLIVGEQIASYSTPLKLTYPRQQNNGATLTLSAHPAYALELQQMTPIILDKIAAYMGFRAVERIAIEQSYHALRDHAQEPPATPAASDDDTSPDPLEAVLARLAKIRASKG